MSFDDLNKLAALIEREEGALLAQWRTQVRELPSARDLDVPTLNDHIPHILTELAAALRSKSAETIPQALRHGSSPAHGLQRVKDEFVIEEVVAEYNILRDCIHDLADQNSLRLQGRPFHILNLVLDKAIGLAVQTFATQRALQVQQRREEHLTFVTHDLRTPLNAISLSAGVLEMLISQNRTDTPEATQMLKALNRNVQYIEALVKRVMEESANLETELGVKVERRELDLWPLVEALVHDLNPVAGTCTTRMVNDVPEDFVVYADANLLRRIFQNLIANAISYTPSGEIVIGARRTGDGSAAECFVRDNGKGISAELCQTVFNKHVTDREDGLGLGLAIVKTFVEAHSGAVTVESELDVGSIFRFTLADFQEIS